MLVTCGVQSNNLSTLFTAISYSYFVRKFTPKSAGELLLCEIESQCPSY